MIFHCCLNTFTDLDEEKHVDCKAQTFGHQVETQAEQPVAHTSFSGVHSVLVKCHSCLDSVPQRAVVHIVHESEEVKHEYKCLYFMHWRAKYILHSEQSHRCCWELGVLDTFDVHTQSDQQKHAVDEDQCIEEALETVVTHIDQIL